MRHLFEDEAAGAIKAALKRLLSEKHLYQSVDIDESFVGRIATLILQDQSEPVPGRLPIGLGAIAAEGKKVLTGSWIPKGSLPGAAPLGSTVIEFQFPGISTFCSPCGDSYPHNPIIDHLVPAEDVGVGDQRFFVGYQCQKCHAGEVWFLIRREGKKLRLAGRDPLECLPTPKVLPKPASNYFGDAQVAHHAGQTLAGLFLLRVFIEQFWRSTAAVQKVCEKKPKATGDEMGSAYNDTLPEDFKNRFPSLLATYDGLSAALHSANADADLFGKASGEIVTHFDARRLFQIAS